MTSQQQLACECVLVSLSGPLPSTNGDLTASSPIKEHMVLVSTHQDNGKVTAIKVNDAESQHELLCIKFSRENAWCPSPSSTDAPCILYDPTTSRTYCLRPSSPKSSSILSEIFKTLPTATAPTAATAAATTTTNMTTTTTKTPTKTSTPRTESTRVNDFDRKTDKGSAELYFHYYGMLQHQQNMLQDYIRTGTYYSAITENAADFEGKAVLDVGCGSGILSLFAAKAGARVVYAVEASNMAVFAAQLAQCNPEIGRRVRVLHGKVEEINLPEQVDVLVSEPMGTLLVNERMLETYIYARDRFLKPGGKLFPRIGRIHVAAFSDPLLYAEVASKAEFWQQTSFYGVNLTSLHAPATAGYFSQVIVDHIPPHVLVSNTAARAFDFATCSEGELHEFTIPLSLQIAAPCTIHGIASWFDVLFDGTTVQRYLSTSPGLPVTHWFQLRCLLETPIEVVRPGETVWGTLRLVAHSRQSYDVHLTLKAPGVLPSDPPQESSGVFDLKEPYYRQLTNWQWPDTGTGTGAATGGVVAATTPPQQQEHGVAPAGAAAPNGGAAAL